MFSSETQWKFKIALYRVASTPAVSEIRISVKIILHGITRRPEKAVWANRVCRLSVNSFAYKIANVMSARVCECACLCIGNGAVVPHRQTWLNQMSKFAPEREVVSLIKLPEFY